MTLARILGEAVGPNGQTHIIDTNKGGLCGKVFERQLVLN